MNEEKKKYRTYIDGLDRLLGGGFCLSNNESLVIVIKGGLGSYRTLFGVQMLYGLASGMKTHPNNVSDSKRCADVYFVVNHYTKSQIEEMMLDTFIPYCITSLRKQIIGNAGDTVPELNCFTEFFFDNRGGVASPSHIKIPLEQIKAFTVSIGR